MDCKAGVQNFYYDIETLYGFHVLQKLSIYLSTFLLTSEIVECS